MLKDFFRNKYKSDRITKEMFLDLMENEVKNRDRMCDAGQAKRSIQDIKLRLDA